MGASRKSKAARYRDFEAVLARMLRDGRTLDPSELDLLRRQFPQWADTLTNEIRSAEAEFAPHELPPGRPAEPRIRNVQPADVPTLPLGADAELAAGPARPIPFGDYDLQEEIARGGMGIVYRARQRSLDRVVAVKMILAGQFAGPEDVQRFRREAQAAAHLEHPGIVPIYEVGEHEGQHYFSMAYVDGPSLARRLAQGPLAPREAAELVRRVAQAIQFAHDRGVVHRDLKPANILLARSDDPSSRLTYQPKVTDFGVAKRLAGEPEQTATGTILGTPSYMPPEQASGQVEEVGPAADVYALGAILYAALTCRPPFLGATPLDTLRQVLERDAAPIRQLNAAVDRDLETICLKCLEKRPERRYRTAEQLAADLQRWLRHEPIEARPVGRIVRLQRWCQRQPIVAGLTFLIASVLCLGIAVSTYFATRALNYAHVLEDQLYIQRINLSYREWSGNDIVRAKRLLQECPPHARNWEWYFCRNLYQQEALVFQGHEYRAFAGETYMRGILDAQFHPAGHEVASAGADGKIHLWNATTGETRLTLSGHKDDVFAVAFSADGNWIVSGGRDGTVQVHDTRTGERRLRIAGHRDWILDVALSRDGRRIASAGGSWGVTPPPEDYVVRIWDFESGELVHALEGHTQRVRSLSFSDDGRRLVTASSDATVRIWDVEQGTCLRILEPGDDLLHAAGLSPDGQLCVAGGMDGTIRMWHTSTGELLRSFDGHQSFVRSLVFNADATRLLSAAEDNTVKLWDVLTGREICTYRGHRDFVNSAAFNASGERIVSASDDNTVRIWNSQSNLASLAIPLNSGWLDAVAFSSDSETLFVGCRQQGTAHGGLFRISVPTGTILAAQQDPAPAGDVLSLAVTSDEQHVLSHDWSDGFWVWDAPTVQRLRKIITPTGPTQALAIHPKLQQVALASQGWIALSHIESGELLTTLPVGPGDPLVRSVAYSPDGQIMAALAEDDLLRVWDLRRRVLLATLPAACPREGRNALRFSPDGRQLAAACSDSTIRIWDTRSYRLLHTLPGHTGPVYQVAYSPDGTRLASASRDKTIKLWDPHSAREIFTLRGHTATVLCVAFSPDGRYIASGGVDHVLRLWKADLPSDAR